MCTQSLASRCCTHLREERGIFQSQIVKLGYMNHAMGCAFSRRLPARVAAAHQLLHDLSSFCFFSLVELKLFLNIGHHLIQRAIGPLRRIPSACAPGAHGDRSDACRLTWRQEHSNLASRRGHGAGNA